MQVTVLKHASFCHPRSLSNKELRKQVKDRYGVTVRRLDNFTLCGLAAVAELDAPINTYKQLSLFSCAQYFSIELVQQILIDMQEGKAIRPLDFVCTVGNAANFYIAKEFSINGSNLFIGADKDAFEKTTLLSALEVNDEQQSAVIMAIWRETEEERCCHAFLVRHSGESDNELPIYDDLSEVAKLSTVTSPFLLQLTTGRFIF